MRRLSYLVAAAMIAAVNVAGYIAYHQIAAAGSDHDVAAEAVKSAAKAPNSPFPAISAPAETEVDDLTAQIHTDRADAGVSTATAVAAAEPAQRDPLPRPDARVDEVTSDDGEHRATDDHRERRRHRAREQRRITRPRPEPAVTRPSPPPAPRVEPAPESTRDRLTEIEENPYKQQH